MHTVLCGDGVINKKDVSIIYPQLWKNNQPDSLCNTCYLKPSKCRDFEL